MAEGSSSVSATARIDSAALRHNLERLRRAAPRARLMAVIKADGYGHGAVRVAAALGGADAFAVARLSEARVLREAGVTHRLLLLSGVHGADDLVEAASLGLDLGVQHEWQVAAICAAPSDARFNIWLKVDTGMHRLGVAPSEAPGAYAALRAAPAVRELRLMSHFASADDLQDDATPAQIAEFNSVAAVIGPCETSLANSAGALHWPDSHGDWIRPGIALYGASPAAHGCGADLGLQPAMRFSTRLIATKTVPAGGRVGYGGHWTARSDMAVGIAAVGYADGYPRHVAPGAPVLVEGVRCKSVGRVSMDLMAIALEGLPDGAAQPGAEVTLWGPQLPVDEIARAAGTIPYTLLTAIAGRVSMVTV